MSSHPENSARYGAGRPSRTGGLPGLWAFGTARWLMLAALLLFPALLTGCGYSFDGGSSTVMGDASSTLSIKGVEQPTLYPWLGQILRSNVRDEVNARKVAVWVDSGKSDYTLQLNIIRFTIRESVSNKQDDTLLFRANMRVQAIIYDSSGNTEIWRSGTISYSQSYETYYERTAAELLCKRIAERLVRSMRDKF